MHYYEVWVRDLSYRGTTALTYHADEVLSVGALVQVELQRRTVGAVIVRRVTKPRFKTKPIVAILPLPPLPAALLALGEQILHYYASNLGAITTLLLPAQPPTLPSTPEEARTDMPHSTLPPLTKEQQQAVERCRSQELHLLHGRTGTGKTRVYIELAQRTIDEGRSCIVLTPEISLTSQLSQRFREVFGERVILLHSGLTPKEKLTAWQRILIATEPIVVIGARSALFSPLANVGLIVVDEAHEPAYKQEQAPYYHALRVASMLRSNHQASLVLGTATPSVVDYYYAERKQAPIITMQTLATASEATQRRIVVNLTDRSLFARSAYLSTPLLEEIRASLGRHEQSMLYLNRRGTARVILCDQCGWQALCPHCDLPLTYHADSHTLRCHSCTYGGSAPVSCPQCGNPSIVYKSAGTKMIVEEVQRLFPEAHIQRFDTDNRKAERLEQHYDALHRGEVDILVGTQLLAKGLDLPRLSTVGVIMADSGLTMPDFSASERTYQLLNQVLGRVGRGHRTSTAIIQTYNPASKVIQAAIHNDWQEFYAAELTEREKYLFPPFCFMLQLTCRRASRNAAEKACLKLRDELSAQYPLLVIEGPAPAFHEQQSGKYTWQLVIKSRQRTQLLEALTHLPSTGWTYDLDPINLL
jgi:primosomal protein N' (replication factor Y)